MKPLLCKIGLHKVDKMRFYVVKKSGPEEKRITEIIFIVCAAANVFRRLL